jgi:transketolase N-terminal domain/subunit
MTSEAASTRARSVQDAPRHREHVDDEVCINTIRTLAIDAVQKANSGHPGTPMALAPAAYVLWQEFLRYDPADPLWPNRDRFVLSAGHASMLLYAMLHLAQVRRLEGTRLTDEPAVTLDDIKRFRQIDSVTPEHPEYGLTTGVETTTGPLGQGCGNSVGMAIASRWLAAHYNRQDFALFDYDIYAICSDGDLMEGVGGDHRDARIRRVGPVQGPAEEIRLHATTRHGSRQITNCRITNRQGADCKDSPSMNPVSAMQQHGQSVRLNFLARGFMDRGERKKLVEKDGLRGVTSNPSIFEKAIGHSDEYDQGSIPPPERGRSTVFASLRSKYCRVGVPRPALATDDHRGRELTPTRLPPTKSGVAGLPLSGGGIAESAAPMSPPPLFRGRYSGAR